MKFTLKICDNREEEIIVFAKEKNNLICEIEKLITNSIDIIGYNDGCIKKLTPNEIYCFAVENNKIFAYLEKEKYQLKQRLYEIESLLDSSFVKINQSCIVNVSKIDKFDASFAGAMMVTLKNGYKDYISRRQLKLVKERIGF